MGAPSKLSVRRKSSSSTRTRPTLEESRAAEVELTTVGLRNLTDPCVCLFATGFKKAIAEGKECHAKTMKSKKSR